MLAVALLALSAALPADPPRYAVAAKDVKRVRGVVTYDVACPNFQATDWVCVAAAAPELPGQTKVKTTLDAGGAVAREQKDQSPFARPLLVAAVPARTADRRTALPIRVTYEATLRSRTLEALPPDAKPPAVPNLTPAARKLLLGEHGDVAFKADPFRQWMTDGGFVRQDGEGEVEFARRVFLGIRAGFRYEYTPGASRSAPAVSKAGRSDCGGLSVLFVAVMRANRIPARALCGRWAVSADPKEKLADAAYYQWHVKAEFFADGVGWVPVDVSGGILHDKSAEGLRYFGADPGDFLAFHTDTDLVVETKAFGAKTAHNLQQPGWWARGVGSLEPTRTTEGWTVEVVK